MNWKTFLALLARDAHVARRNFVPLLLQTFLQPMMFVFIFGRVMVCSGYMPDSYKSLLLPGIMAISMNATAEPMVIFDRSVWVPRGPNAVLETELEKSAPASALPG